jgi:hypothetical protein
MDWLAKAVRGTGRSLLRSEAFAALRHQQIDPYRIEPASEAQVGLVVLAPGLSAISSAAISRWSRSIASKADRCAVDEGARGVASVEQAQSAP